MTWRRTVEKTWEQRFGGFVPPKQSRYRAVGVRDADGTFFHSKGELRRWQELQMLEKSGKIRDLNRQLKYQLAAASLSSAGIHAIPCAHVTWDFQWTDAATGEVVVEDFKSPATAKDEAYRLRKRWFEACYPFTVRETMRTKRWDLHT